MANMLRSALSFFLVIAIVGGLWKYADERSAPAVPSVMRPDYPMSIAGVSADPQSMAQVAPWSLGDIDALSS
jgi:hypothetical protein